MRNLKISVLDVEHNSILRECVSFCVNTNNENVYFVKGDSVVILPSDFGENSNLTHIPIDPSIEGKIISAQYLYESNVLCIGTSTGDLTTICETTHQVECVGNVLCGLKAIAWSPDEDLLALITGEDNLILMTKDFDPLLEKYLHPDDFGENKPVTAGWGSKETQFHGSEGKGARNVKLVVESAHAWDDHLPVVTWRGDGQLFAVSTVHPQKEYRQIRIWDREGTLLCTSEAVNGLEGPINWRPSGSVIAGIQRLPKVHQVVFFEKNGLRHREFQLPFQPMEFEVKGLSWNSDSTILAVWGRNLHSEDSSSKRGWKVMIWTMSNYHWFLKLSLDFKDQEVSCLMWDVISPFVLRLFSSRTGLFLKYSFCWSTDRSTQPVDCKTDPAFVCVAAGNILNVTPFGKMIVPPPLCAYSFILPSPVSQVVFGPSTHSSDIIAVLTDNRLAKFSYDNGDSELEKEDVNEKQECFVKLGMIGANGGRTVFRPHVFKTIATIKWEKQMSSADIPGAAHHWLWVKEDVLVCSLPDDNRGDSLFSIELKKEPDQKELVGKFCCKLCEPIIAMCVLQGKTIAIQLTNGLVFKYNLDDNVLTPWELPNGSQLKIPQPSPYMCACKIDAQDHLLSLSTRNRFFCDNRELLNNCTSFALHNEFLLLTTHSHTLRCLHLKYDLPKLLGGQPLVALDESPRSVERGSQLVTSSSSETRVVLQMPRGNLEAIHPRTLLLHTVSNLLDKLNFREAFELMRKHRINLNLLYDHNPEVFMKNAEVFVKDVNNPDHINLFLAELMADDVTSKMYSSVYRNLSKLETVEECKLSKVDSICDKLKTALQNVDPKKFFLSIITTHAKKTTPELDVALQKVKELRDSDTECQSVANGALEHLLYMVDVNQLYDIALGTYDFDTVLMVAEKSQKDPKEYLQFLNGLKALETNYQKYRIDMHLRRYKKALVHIANCGESHFEECIQLVQSQKLYRDALRIFPTGTPQNKKIWEKYGDYLVSKRQLEEAGLAFQCSGHWDCALSAHQGALVWEMALYDAEQLSYGPLQMSQLAKSLAENLKANGRHSESANLFEQYAQDEEECIATLVEGQLWNVALLKISKYRRSDLLETHLKPALLENSSEMVSNIEQMSEDFAGKVQRLQKVRENRSKPEVEFPDEELLLHSQADAFSDVSSVAALSQNSASNTVLSGSINTRRTGRNRQKQELKKYSLKEGSQFEDLALISALSQLVRSADDLRDPCSSILKILVLFNFDKEASLLQKKMQSFYSLIEDYLSIIWPPEDSQTAKPVIELGPTATSNLIAASMQQQQQRRPVISDPSLRIPPRFKKEAEWKLFVLENTN